MLLSIWHITVLEQNALKLVQVVSHVYFPRIIGIQFINFLELAFAFDFCICPQINSTHTWICANFRGSDQDVPVVPNDRNQGLDWLPTRSPHLLQSLSISGFLVENLEIDLNRWQFWLAGCAECRPGEPETASNCRGSRQLLLIYLIIISRIRMVIRIIIITMVLVEWCWWCEWSHLSAVALFSKPMDLEGQERTNQQKLVFVIKIDRRDGSYVQAIFFSRIICLRCFLQLADV